MSIRQVNGVLVGYDKGVGSGLSAAEKSGALVGRGGLGVELVSAIKKHYEPKPDGSNSSQRHRLVNQTVAVFETAGMHAQQLRTRSLLKRPLTYRKDAEATLWLHGNPNTYATSAASQFLKDGDVKAAARLLEIGFDIAEIKDRLIGPSYNTYHKGGQREIVLGSIEAMADSQTSAESGFRLYALAYNLSKRIPSKSGAPQRIARSFLTYLENNIGAGIQQGEFMADEIDRAFVEAAFESVTGDNNWNWSYPLSLLSGRVADPDLRQAIEQEELRSLALANDRRRAIEEKRDS